MKIKKCRNCESKKLKSLFSLGNLSFTGKFKKDGSKVGSGFLNLIMCLKCKLVQLDRNFNLKYLYNNEYGYRSGINFTMRNHLKYIANLSQKKTKLRNGDYVLDIASNDGTLLNFYKKKNIIKVGIDPILNKFKKNYKNIDFKFASFFDLKLLKSKIFKKKFKIITALSVFYDLTNPNKFLADVSKILDKNGIFILEFADLRSIVKNNIFDTICHEHLEYYSVYVIKNMLKKHNLEIFDYKTNDINGGSSLFFISHLNSKKKVAYHKIKKIISLEKRMGLYNPKFFKKFFKRIIKIGDQINKILKNAKKNKMIIHGYGASTKGNVLLQFFRLRKYFSYVCDRNSKKVGLRTPGTNIRIISEKQSRNLKPDIYFVLPWHFKKEILLREKNIRKKGTKFIFPLPKFKMI